MILDELIYVKFSEITSPKSNVTPWYHILRTTQSVYYLFIKKHHVFSIKNFLNFVRSQAVKYGDTVYLSGALGLDVSTGKLVEGGAGPETKKALENIKYILEGSQSSFSSGWFKYKIFN